MKPTARRNHSVLIITLAVTLFAGITYSCATMEKENRRLTNYLDEEAAPESRSARLLLLPVTVPVGTAALAADAAVVHPAVMLPQCIKETYELIWADPQGSMVRQSFLIIPKILSTPVYFGVSWGWSSVFMGNLCE